MFKTAAILIASGLIVIANITIISIVPEKNIISENYTQLLDYPEKELRKKLTALMKNFGASKVNISIYTYTPEDVQTIQTRNLFEEVTNKKYITTQQSQNFFTQKDFKSLDSFQKNSCDYSSIDNMFVIRCPIIKNYPIGYTSLYFTTLILHLDKVKEGIKIFNESISK